MDPGHSPEGRVGKHGGNRRHGRQGTDRESSIRIGNFHACPCSNRILAARPDDEEEMFT